jgi:hypothetical protein
MEAIWIAIVVGLVVAIVVPVCAAQWARVRRAEAEARVKQDMLARGLSVEEIERLSAPANVRLAQIDADRRVREAQVGPDLTRDMLARGLSVEEIKRLTTETGAGLHCEEAGVLADAIVNMVQGEQWELNRNAVAGLIEMFLKRNGTTPECRWRPYSAEQPTGGAKPTNPAERFAPAERPRE